MQKNKNIISILFSLITIFLGVVFVAWTFIPHVQMVRYYGVIKAFRIDKNEKLEQFNLIFSPYTYVQGELRDDLINRIIDEYQKDKKTPLLAFLPQVIKKLEEHVEKNPLHPKYFVSIAKGYGLLYALDNSHPEYLTKGEEYYKKALLLMPKSPEIAYGYTVNLTNQKRYLDAYELAKKNLENTPTVAQSYNYLGFALFERGPQYYNDALIQFENAFSLKENTELVSVPGMYEQMFKYYYKIKDQEHFLIVIRRLKQIDSKQSNLYSQLEEYILKNKKIPLININ